MSSHHERLAKTLALGAALLFSLPPADARAQAASDVVCNKCVDTTDIANGAVTFRKIAPGAIGNSRIADEAITWDKIKPGNVNTGRLTDGAVTRPKLADGAVTAAKLAPGVLSPDNIFARTIVLSPGPSAAANGADLLAALASISGNGIGTDDRWLIKLEPGIYNVGTSTVGMKDFVDIEGSGEAVTLSLGDRNEKFTGVVSLRFGSELRYVSVQNDGTSNTNATAISVSTSDFGRLTHVTAIAADASTNNTALLVNDNATVIVRDSVLDGEDVDVFIDAGSAARILFTQLVHATTVGSAFGFRCVAVFDSSFDEIDLGGHVGELTDDTNCGV